MIKFPGSIFSQIINIVKMKNLLWASLLFLAFSSTVSAQDWNYDLNEAKLQAAKHNFPIILVFQGSDWCVPCIKLDKEIWSTDAFKSYASNHFVMLKADFPRKKANSLSAEQQEKNNKLAETYNQSGFFPLVVVLDKEGNVLGKTGYKKLSPKEYIDHLESFLK